MITGVSPPQMVLSTMQKRLSSRGCCCPQMGCPARRGVGAGARSCRVCGEDTTLFLELGGSRLGRQRAAHDWDLCCAQSK